MKKKIVPFYNPLKQNWRDSLWQPIRCWTRESLCLEQWPIVANQMQSFSITKEPSCHMQQVLFIFFVTMFCKSVLLCYKVQPTNSPGTAPRRVHRDLRPGTLSQWIDRLDLAEDLRNVCLQGDGDRYALNLKYDRKVLRLQELALSFTNYWSVFKASACNRPFY